MNKNTSKYVISIVLVILAGVIFAFAWNYNRLEQGGTEDGGKNFTSSKSVKFTSDNYPRVDGSTATIPLSEAFMAATTGQSREAVADQVVSSKTHGAYVNLIEKKADLILVTEPSEEELTLAREAGVEFEIIPVVNEAFVFLVNGNNPVEGLSAEEIRQIYEGKITNWSQVGGNDQPIIAYQRPENSGSQTGMISLVMEGRALMTPPQQQIMAEMGGLVDAVADYTNAEGAIGYSYYYFVTDMYKSMNIKLLTVDGVSPDKEQIMEKRYPFNSAYYIVMRKDEPIDSPVRKLADFMLSEVGQKVAEEAGYVPIK